MELTIKILSCLYALFFVISIFYFYKYIYIVYNFKKNNKDKVDDNDFKISYKKIKRKALILWLTFLLLFLITVITTYILVYA